MEMMFKLPPRKPPFIGIIFKNSEEAEMNKDLLELKGAKFSILVEGKGADDVSFMIGCEAPVLVRHYDKVKVNWADFKRWRVYSHMRINFGHVILVHDQPVVVKLKEKLFVIQIEHFITG